MRNKFSPDLFHSLYAEAMRDTARVILAENTAERERLHAAKSDPEAPLEDYELSLLKSAHRGTEDATGLRCVRCKVEWPCKVYRALNELQKLRG